MIAIECLWQTLGFSTNFGQFFWKRWKCVSLSVFHPIKTRENPYIRQSSSSSRLSIYCWGSWKRWMKEKITIKPRKIYTSIEAKAAASQFVPEVAWECGEWTRGKSKKTKRKRYFHLFLKSNQNLSKNFYFSWNNSIAKILKCVLKYKYTKNKDYLAITQISLF